MVIAETKKLLTKKNIDDIARQVVAFTKSHVDNSELNHLKKRLKENKKATANLIKALEQGDVTDIITDQLQKRKQEKHELEIQIAKEEIKFPDLTVSKVKFFMSKFLKGNINDLKYRKSLVNIFVKKIVLYDNKITILFNIGENVIESPLDEKCSSKGQLVEARGVELMYSWFRCVYRIPNCPLYSAQTGMSSPRTG